MGRHPIEQVRVPAGVLAMGDHNGDHNRFDGELPIHAVTLAGFEMDATTVTNDAVTMPVFRPLIGFDKEEIVTRAKAMGSYETSILPFEDCCTVFVPQHPVTRPKLADILQSEARLDFTQMIETAIANTEFLAIE